MVERKARCAIDLPDLDTLGHALENVGEGIIGLRFSGKAPRMGVTGADAETGETDDERRRKTS